MIPRFKASLGWPEIKTAFSKAAKDDIEVFEQKFAQLAEQKHAIAFPYGRTALVAILKALELQGAEIICPSYTCVVVAHAIVTSGNIPVFVDSNPIDYNMDMELLDKAVSKKTRAVICTSIFGHPINLDKLDVFKKRNPNVIIIQDCAHSFFCQWNREMVNKQGICAFYGLNASKIITSIFGGMVTTDNIEFSNRLRKERDNLITPTGLLKTVKRMTYLLAIYIAFTRVIYGFVNRMERYGYLNRFVKYYEPEKITMPSDYLQAITALEARVGTVQCQAYTKTITHRRKLAKVYLDGLGYISSLQLPLWNSGATYSHFVVKTSKAKLINEVCLKNGIQLGNLINYYIPEMPAYQNFKAYDTGNAKQWPGQVINLPIHVGISMEDAKKIIVLINSTLKSN